MVFSVLNKLSESSYLCGTVFKQVTLWKGKPWDSLISGEAISDTLIMTNALPARIKPWSQSSVMLFLFQVARLMEMGFSRGDALEALRASNNDLNVATNFLLQH